MKNEAILGAAGKLLSVMDEITGILNSLYACAKEQETLLTSQNIEGLIALREKEEEFIFELGRSEEERIEAAALLASAVGAQSPKSTIDQLALNIEDAECKAKLISAKTIMADTVKELSMQNAKNRELLNHHINYTEYMINLLLVPRSRSNFYNVQGARKDESSNINLLDFHI